MQKYLKIVFSALIPIFILLMPTSWFPFDNISTIEHRIIAIFVMAVLFWILEPIPIFATSLLIIVLELVMVSDQSLVFFAEPSTNSNFGGVLNYKEIMATFASPIILLFLGGFFLSIAATKYRLDVNLARVLLKPFGKNPRMIMLGLMCITAFFSMFMSNTATTAMMLAILTPVLKAFKKNDPGRIAVILAIPFAANIGGIGTPIGTPPNAIALKYLSGENNIGFGEWMLFGVPFVLVLLSFAWVLLYKSFPFLTTEVQLDIKGKFLKTPKAIIVYLTSVLVIFLWLFDYLHGMNAYIVAMIPVAIFSATQIITPEDLRKISWEVLWLLAGGIALGLGLEKSGLAEQLIHTIPFSDFSPYMIVGLATLLTITMANFMSHTATANLLLPIVAVIGSLSILLPLGGSKMLILAVTFAASLAMSLAISTPPNAMAHATGLVSSRAMFKIGTIIGFTGLVMVYIMMFLLKQVGFL